MATAPPSSSIPQRNWLLLLLALGFVLAAWAVVIAGEKRVSSLLKIGGIGANPDTTVIP